MTKKTAKNQQRARTGATHTERAAEHTVPPDVLDKIRSADAMCSCGRTADEHLNRMGPCPASDCAQWTWGPAERTTRRRPAGAA